MNYCISVKFEETKKSYFFQTDDESISLNDFVVVETIVGKEIGQVVSNKRSLAELKFDKEIKPILRKATKKDLQAFEDNKESAKKASEIFNKATKDLNLDMRLIKSEYTLDKEKILFTYFSEERVDFRELLKELANELHCRIELRQVGPRNKAKMVGGLGNCGMETCCSRFLNDFDKLSGVCGKLLCCLKYEDDFYTESKKDFPPINTTFKYNNEEYKISSYNILTKIIKCVSTDNVEFLPLDEVNKYVKQSGKLPQKKQPNKPTNKNA